MKKKTLDTIETRRRPQKEDITHFLTELNQHLEGFIKGLIKSSKGFVEPSFDTERWGDLSGWFKPIRCWKIMGCSKKDCPAYSSKDYHCWLLVGTMCGGEVQGEFAKKYETCFDCKVFRIISKEPVRLLYENINTIISHLKNWESRLLEFAIKDQLTGLYNRHLFNEIIEREMTRAERDGQAISFIMTDLDDLKHINDTLGHLTGDRMLVETAKLIKDTVRRSDLVFRFGGDEFLVLMVNADCDKVTNMVDRLLYRVDRWNKDNADTYGCRLSLSIGCSTCEKGGDVLEALRDADAKMYQNKMKKMNNIEERQV